MVPGFDFKDHDFLDVPGLTKLVGQEKADQLIGLCKK